MKLTTRKGELLIRFHSEHHPLGVIRGSRTTHRYFYKENDNEVKQQCCNQSGEKVRDREDLKFGVV